jgi:hypothetical protein
MNFKGNINKVEELVLVPLIGIFSYPTILSYDIFNYIATAKVAFKYFENPYIVMPIDMVGDKVLLFTRAANKIALYGPFWVGLTSIPYYLSFDNYLASIILFKTLIAIFFIGTVYLIWRMTKNMYSVLFFAASPLVLVETFISGHNDVVMMFFALLSINMLKNKKITFALILLLLSILIKYATIFLIPVFIYYFYLKLKNREVSWDKMYFLSFILMMVIFFLSPIREELYPWYAIWPLTFLALVADKKKTLSTLFVVFTFGLMLRYVPFMLIGTYFGPTPFIRIGLTITPVGLYLFYLFLSKKIKYLFR